MCENKSKCQKIFEEFVNHLYLDKNTEKELFVKTFIKQKPIVFMG